MIIIYKISNIENEKLYIGQTSQTLSKRFKHHKKPSSECLKLKNAMKKYNISNFRIDFILLAHTQEVADYWEQFFIEKYDSIKNGYNIRLGGNASPMKGRLHSEKTKMKMSEMARTRKASEETKKKISEANMGRIFSDESKLKMSTSAKGNTARLGTAHSEESKKKMSLAIKGRTWKMINGKRVYSKRVD